MTRITVGIAALAIASTGAAAQINSTLNSISPALNVKWSLDSSGFATTQAGVFNWTRNSGSISSPLTTNFAAFCIELTQNVSVNSSYNYDETPLDSAPVPASAFAPMGAADAAKIARIYTVWANDVSGSANLRAAAAQAAIWETIFGTDDDLTSGNFLLDTSHSNSNQVALKANQYLVAQLTAAPRSGLFALTSTSAQDMVVPAPGAFALIGLGGLAAARRRR